MEFEITSSPSSTVIFSGIIAAIMLSIGFLFIWFTYSASHLSVRVEGVSLHIKVPIYSRSIPLSRIDASSAKIVNLDNSSELRPRIRTNGIGLPGYAVGWFKLYNGEKALAAITSRKDVMYIRTYEGYSLLLSLKDPQSFMKQLASG